MPSISESVPADQDKIPQSSPRFTHVDSIRGGLLIVMALNHISSPLQVLTNHFLGFISGAEGFVFISGLMCGYVYSRRYYKLGFASLKEAALRRAKTTYLYHIATFAAVLVGLHTYMAVAKAIPSSAPEFLIYHPLTALASSLVFLQQPSLFDILPLYCVFLLVLPLIILACAHGEQRTVLATGLSLWLLVNLFSPQAPVIHGAINTGSFNLLAWQLLFVAGAVFGHAWAVGKQLIPRPRGWIIFLGTLAAGMFFLVRHAYLHLPLSAAWLDWATNKNNLAPLRLLDVGIVFYLAYALTTRVPEMLTWRPLVFLGENSIFVFAMHIVVAYAIQSLPGIFDADLTGRWMATLLMTASLFAAAAFHRKTQPRRARPALAQSLSTR